MQWTEFFLTAANAQISGHAAAVLGNLAAGSHQMKDAMRDAGAIPPLVRLLHDSDDITAELAAVALRNLSMQNALNRDAIIAADGLVPLLQLLSVGIADLQPPLRCQV